MTQLQPSAGQDSPLGTRNPGPGTASRASRFRSSIGGLIVPIAIIGAISAAETARTTDAQREVFFNIKAPVVMYFFFAAFVAIVAGAFIQRLRIWRLGKPQGVFDHLGARIYQALTMGTFTVEISTHIEPAHRGRTR